MSRTCLDCGRDISDRGPRAVRCVECADAKTRQAQLDWHRRKSGKQTTPTPPPAPAKPRAKGPVMGEKDDMEKRPADDAMRALMGQAGGAQASELSFAQRIRKFHAACHLHYADECDPAKRKHLALAMAQLNVLEQVYKS